jgi:glycosyltransferase involved in cell wall biosynthesis
MNKESYVTLPRTAADTQTADNNTVGSYLTYPDVTGKRIAEGGKRLHGEPRQSMPEAPLVTIITVCFNSAKTIEQCIDSVLAQSYPNIEYIIVDAASTDGTQAIIERHSQAIDYYVSEPDRGLYHAMNKGLALASGDYILMLNSDDWYVDTAVEELVKAQLACGKDFVSSLAHNVDAEGRLLGTIRSLPYDAGIRLRMPLRHETMLVSRVLYEAVGGYDETYRIIADFDLTLRLYLAGFSHFELPRPLMYFRNTGVSSTALEKLFAERRILLSRQFPSLDRTCLEILGQHGQLAPDNISLFFSGHLEGAALRLYRRPEINRPSSLVFILVSASAPRRKAGCGASAAHRHLCRPRYGRGGHRHPAPGGGLAPPRCRCPHLFPGERIGPAVCISHSSHRP